MPEKTAKNLNTKGNKSPWLLVIIVTIIAIAVVAIVNMTKNKPAPVLIPTDISEFRQAVADQHVEIQDLREELRKLKQNPPSKSELVIPNSLKNTVEKNSSYLKLIDNRVKKIESEKTSNKVIKVIEDNPNLQTDLQTSLAQITEHISSAKEVQGQIVERLNSQEKAINQIINTKNPATSSSTVIQSEKIKEDIIKQVKLLTKQLSDHENDAVSTITNLKKQQQSMENRTKSIEVRTQELLKRLDNPPQPKPLTTTKLVEALAIVQVIRDRMARGKTFDDVLPFLKANLKFPSREIKEALKDLAGMRESTTRSKLTIEVEDIYREVRGEQKLDEDERSAFDFSRIEVDRCKDVAKYVYTATASGNVTAALEKLENNRNCRTTRMSKWERDAIIFVRAEEALANIEDSLVIKITKIKDLA